MPPQEKIPVNYTNKFREMFEATTYNEFVIRGILVRVLHMFNADCRHNKGHSGALKPWTVSQTC